MRSRALAISNDPLAEEAALAQLGQGGSAVGAVLAPYIPSTLVALLSAAGIAAIRLDAASAKGLKGQRTIALPAPSQWPERAAATIAVGPTKLPLTWLARGPERAWATGGPTETPSAKDIRAR